ncbi:MAG: HAMP domain-containing sensor histidine kinase [Bacteroidota bacterium]|nr:HAMP domain-containing sensor histidine kinase [Bacteroidota bacterium]
MNIIIQFWKRLQRIGYGSNPHADIEIAFLNQACILAFFCTLPISLAAKLIFDSYDIYVTIALFAFGFLAGLVFNYFRFFILSKFYFFLLIQFAICWGACILGRDAGIQNISLVLFLSPVIYYNKEEILQRVVALFIPIGGLLALYISDFSLFANQIKIESRGFYAFQTVVLVATIVAYFINVLSLRKSLTLQNKSIEQKNEELMESINKVNKLNENLDKFVYTVSHDLRSPISSALGLIELSKTEKDIDTIHEYMVIQEKSMRRMNDFVSDMLAYYKNSKSINYYENIELDKLLDDIIEAHATLLKDNNITVDIDINQPEKFRSDPMKLRIILTNIVSNAIRYIDDNKGTHTINIKINTDPKQGVFIFTDNGIGIAEESQEKVFEMFYRATFNKSGTGLGLFMVRELLGKLWGTVSLESEEKVYTTFTIIIPNQGLS